MRVLAWVLFGLAFLMTAVWTVEGWGFEQGYWEHGPVLALVAGYLVWRGAQRARRLPQATSWLGIALLSSCLALHVVGQALLVDGLSGLVLVPAALALTWALEGKRRLGAVAPAIIAFAFAVPLPIFVTGKIAYYLKHLATAASTALASCFGAAFEQDGARILVPGQADPLLVGDACSGLRSLVALLALGYVYAFFFTRRSLASRLAIVALAVPIAVLANVVRITVLALVARGFGTKVATGVVHDVSGVFVYLLALVLLLALDFVLPGRRPPQRSADAMGVAMGEPGVSPAAGTAQRSSRVARAAALLLAGFGGFALFLAATVPSDERALFAPRVATASARFETLRELDFPEEWYGMLGTKDVCWRRYKARGDASATLDVTAIFQGSSWKSLHPPEVCLLSAGFDIVDSKERSAESLGERFGLTLLEAFHERDQRRYLIAYVFVGEGFKTPSFFDFFLRSIPTALFRRESRAALLRLDIPWPEGVARSVIETRIADFYEDMMPHLVALLRS